MLKFENYNLRTGDYIEGTIRPPKETERYFALLTIEAVNMDKPEMAKTKILFDNLTPTYPNERLKMETVAERIFRPYHGSALPNRQRPTWT
jgi:transcription termination factor Rho